MSEYQGIVYAAPPPSPDIIPNFNNPSNSGSLVISICVLLPLTVIITGFRIWTRAQNRQFGLDDWLMIAATALSVVMAALIIDMLPRGMGHHIWDVPVTILFPGFMLRNIILAATFCLASAIAKLSILAMYLRIFTAGTMFRTAIFVTGAIIAGYGIATALVNVFSCSPIAASWQLDLAATGKCIDRPAFYLAQAGLGIVADIVTVIIPIPAISKLVGLDMKKKISIMLMLSMGGFVCIVSAIRLKSLINMLNTTDVTRVTPDALMWCYIELSVSIIGGCIPALKLLFRRYLPFLVSGSSRSKSHGLSYQPQSFGTQKPKGFSAISKTITVSVTRPDRDRNADDNDSVEELVNMRGRPQIVHDKRWTHAQ